MNTTKITEELPKQDFKELIERYKIKVSNHAFDHLSNAQRNVFKEEDLKNIILKENPRGIGKQRNGRYAVFYKRKEGFIKIICEIKRNQFIIITFMNIDNMPNLKRMQK